jgi:hypothetical protein
VAVLTTSNGKHIPLLDITGVVENELDGSLDVWCGGQSTHLEAGEDAQAFKDATQSVAPPPYQQQMPGTPLLERLRAQRG